MPPLTETGPVKRLSASVRVRLPLPALKLLLPVTVSTPVCVMPPLALVTLSAPPTLALPNTIAPRLDKLSAPLVVIVPKRKSLASRKVTALALADTAALKSLPALFRTMVPLPALRLVVPVTLSAPVWLMGLLPLTTIRAPPTLLAPKFNAPALVSFRLPPTWTSTEARPSLSCR